MKRTSFLTLYMILILMLFTSCDIPNYQKSDTRVEEGNIKFDEGQYVEAIQLYDLAIEANRYNGTAFGNKAAALIALDRYDEALEFAEQALKLSPKEAMLHLNMGDALSGVGEYEDALKSFDEAIKLDKNLLDAYNSKGAAYYYMGKIDLAMEHFNKVLDMDTSYSSSYFWKAQILMEQKKYEEALDACDRGISRDKKEPAGYNKKAQILYAMKKQEDAFSVLDKAIAINLEIVDSYLEKLSLLYKTKNYEQAVAFGLDALKKFPQNEDLNWYIADSYSAQFLHEDAIKHYLLALQANPKNDQVAAYAGWEYYYLQDYTNAEKYANKALELYSDNFEAQNLQTELDKTKLPEAERIVDFVKSNYLYLKDIKGFEKISESFKEDSDITVEDVARYIESIRKKQDVFTFVISGKEYDYMAQENLTNQVSGKELQQNTYYIRIDTFTPNVGYDFRKTIGDIRNTEETNLIIDLRGNGGGVINASNDILDLLLPECYTSYLIDRNGYIDSYFSDENQVSFKKILILVDENSASSAELLTLGLRKYLDNVVVIGRPTFGKGVGQNIYEDKQKKYMIFLVGFYWNVKEENIADSKISPDVKIKGSSNEEYMRAIKAQIK